MKLFVYSFPQFALISDAGLNKILIILFFRLLDASMVLFDAIFQFSFIVGYSTLFPEAFSFVANGF